MGDLLDIEPNLTERRGDPHRAMVLCAARLARAARVFAALERRRHPDAGLRHLDLLKVRRARCPMQDRLERARPAERKTMRVVREGLRGLPGKNLRDLPALEIDDFDLSTLHVDACPVRSNRYAELRTLDH